MRYELEQTENGWSGTFKDGNSVYPFPPIYGSIRLSSGARLDLPASPVGTKVIIDEVETQHVTDPRPIIVHAGEPLWWTDEGAMNRHGMIVTDTKFVVVTPRLPDTPAGTCN